MWLVMSVPMPVTEAIKAQEAFFRAQEEAALRASILLMGRAPGDRRAAEVYLEASRKFEEGKR